MGDRWDRGVVAGEVGNDGILVVSTEATEHCIEVETSIIDDVA